MKIDLVGLPMSTTIVYLLIAFFIGFGLLMGGVIFHLEGARYRVFQRVLSIAMIGLGALAMIGTMVTGFTVQNSNDEHLAAAVSERYGIYLEPQQRRDLLHKETQVRLADGRTGEAYGSTKIKVRDTSTIVTLYRFGDRYLLAGNLDAVQELNPKR